MGMEELSSDSEDGSDQPSHIARYEQWLEQKATRPPSPPPPPRTSESRTGLAKEAASSTYSLSRFPAWVLQSVFPTAGSLPGQWKEFGPDWAVRTPGCCLFPNWISSNA